MRSAHEYSSRYLITSLIAGIRKCLLAKVQYLGIVTSDHPRLIILCPAGDCFIRREDHF